MGFFLAGPYVEAEYSPGRIHLSERGSAIEGFATETAFVGSA